MDIHDLEADSLPESSPLRHISRLHNKLDELVEHMREDVSRIDEPQAEALLETSAETLEGLMNAFEDYVEADEEAWRENYDATHGASLPAE